MEIGRHDTYYMVSVIVEPQGFAEDMRVVQDALTIAIDGRAQRIVGFSLGVKLLAHLIFPPDMLLRVLSAAS